MHIIKLDATDSTNTYLKNLARHSELEDYTTVMAHKQLNGKGQMGAFWEAEPGKNLTFSVLKKFSNFSLADKFLLNICASLAVLNVLKQFSIPNVHVKWPNDILSGTAKICGILVENVVLGDQIKMAIIGVGLNVNQIVFQKVLNASSMKLIAGKTFNLDAIHKLIVEELGVLFSMMKTKGQHALRETYELELFRKDKPATFKLKNGSTFMGFIRGVTAEGKLCVALEGTVLKTFDFKEVQLMY